MSPDGWCRSAKVAFAATKRLMLTLTALTTIPLGVVGLALGASGFGWSVLAATSVATGLFVVSFFAHEFAHALVHTRLALACGGATDLLGVGTAREAAIVRFGLGPRRDALVSVAGPGAGLALSLPLLAPSENFLATGALPVIFLVHALSLLPRASDGRQIRNYLKGAGSPC